MVAALYVETGGVYYGLPGVDPWDEARDARLYAGPWPVVAHPPCQRWCQLAPIVAAKLAYLGDKYAIGNDGGTFEAALNAVREADITVPSDAASRGWFNRRHYRTCIRVGVRLVKVAKAIDVAGQKLIWWGL